MSLDAFGFREFTDDEVRAFETELRNEQVEVDPLDAFGWEEMSDAPSFDIG